MSSEKTDNTFNAPSTLIVFDEVAEQRSRQQIRGMSDVYTLDDEDLDQKKIIYPKMRDGKVLDTFRDLRTKLSEKAGTNNFTLLVTSVCKGGGATFVSSNIGAAFSLDHGKTALIVDCNFYSPAAAHLEHGEEIGFSDYLQDPTVSLDEIIYATGIARLRVVPAGLATEIGPEYFTSYRMTQFIDELRSRYRDRYLILDAPPIGSTADARILAGLCDFVVVVVPSGMVTKEQIAQAVEKIPSEKLAGLIFNN